MKNNFLTPIHQLFVKHCLTPIYKKHGYNNKINISTASMMILNSFVNESIKQQLENLDEKVISQANKMIANNFADLDSTNFDNTIEKLQQHPELLKKGIQQFINQYFHIATQALAKSLQAESNQEDILLECQNGIEVIKKKYPQLNFIKLK